MKEYIEKNQPIFYNLIKNEFSRTVTVLTLHIIQIEIVMKQVEQ